ncbi:hypothetical protein [Rhodococcus sp. NPDC049939]|uniref:hypothetical protein n=1 Tax=Rhodococcus sp. NPDC049939 TaxID=3155511 RepID=UPI0033ECD1BF
MGPSDARSRSAQRGPRIQLRGRSHLGQRRADGPERVLTRHLGYDAPDTRFTGLGGCYVEIGGGMAAKGEGDFLATPAPRVTLHGPSADFHAEKEAQEREWLSRWNTRA